MTRPQSSRVLRVALDVLVLATAYALGFMLRFDWAPPWPMFKRLLITLPYVVLFKYGLLWVFGITRFAWRYVGLRETVRILRTLLLASTALVLMRALLGRWTAQSPVAAAAIIPYCVLAIDFVLAFLGVTGVRVMRRLSYEKAAQAGHQGQGRAAIPTLLIGAGQLGLLTAREVEARPDLGLEVVAFLDDDLEKIGSALHGVRVLGKTADLPRVAHQVEAKQALITIAEPSASLLESVLCACRQAAIEVKIVPGLHDRVGGGLDLARIREVAIEDLLRRKPVVIEQSAIQQYVRGKSVLVTGAGGSIGSELCRQLCRFEPQCLVLVDHAENNLFHCDRELRQQFPELRIHAYLADVTDAPRMAAIFRDEHPLAVFHAAAHKHVPLMEQNPLEAIKNNVFGSKAVADLACAHGVERFILISTDKAVNPSSVMGLCKRVAELYVQQVHSASTRFCAVRFGNVLGSTGSVIPLFRQQIANGGPVTVTHPQMQRYFMTVDEACQLVLQAAALGRGGEIFVLDMGEPILITDLARDLIRLSGLREGEDIQIVFTGMRPGERLHEELGISAASTERTVHPRIFVGKDAPPPSSLSATLEQLRALVQREAPTAEALALLRSLVPEYSPEKPLPLPSTGDSKPKTASEQPLASSPPSTMAASPLLSPARGRP